MTDIRFDENEGILLQTTDVYRYDGKNEVEVHELYLTNKNLISVCKKSKVDRVPLDSIRVVNGIVQVSQVEDDEYGSVLQIIYNNGKRELFELNGFGCQYTTWVTAISDAVLKLINGESFCTVEKSRSSQTEQNTRNDEIKIIEGPEMIGQFFSGFKNTFEKARKTVENTIKQFEDIPISIQESTEPPKEAAEHCDEISKKDCMAIAFCGNCGIQIAATAKFCPECGTKRNSSNNDRSQRQVVYDGVVHKCPNCGDLLDAFELKCEACGYELRSTGNSSAIQNFANEIRKLEMSGGRESSKRIATYISTFPIPNTREELLEFFVLSASNINAKAYGLGAKGISDAEKSISYAYYAKFEQAYRKAYTAFGGTERFNDFAALYQQKNEEIAKEKKKKQKAKLAIILSLVILLLGIIGVVLRFAIPAIEAYKERTAQEAVMNEEKITQESARLEAIVQEVYAALENKNYVLAEAKAATIIFSGPSDKRGLEEKKKWDKIRSDLLSTIYMAELDAEIASYEAMDGTKQQDTTTTVPTEPTESQEILYDINISVECKKNMMFSTYDVKFYIDGILQGTIDHGATKVFSAQLPEGKYTLRFENEENSEVDGEVEIEVSQQENFKCNISCTSLNVEISVEANDEEDELPSTSNASANSFEDGTFQPITIENFAFDLPNYWNEEGSKTEYNQYYAKKGEECIILGIGYPKETDANYDVTFDGLYEDNANMIEMIRLTISDAEVSNYEVFETNYGIKGMLYQFSCNVETDWFTSIKGDGYLFCFPSEKDRRWFYFWYMQTDHVTETNYADDYKTMISTIREET